MALFACGRWPAGTEDNEVAQKACDGLVAAPIELNRRANVNRKRKRHKKLPIGRETLRDVQERAVPRASQYAGSTAFKKNADRQRRLEARDVVAAQDAVVMPLNATDLRTPTAIMLSVLLFSAWIFAYLPTIKYMVERWTNEPDYSHGFLVVPLALLLVWIRRETFPGISQRVSWSGAVLIALAALLHSASRLLYMDFLDGYSIPVLAAGLIWLLAGWPALRWSTAPILFLFMMVPLPYRLETGLSWTLQGIATQTSAAMLLILGQPALITGHVISIGEQNLLVEEACSGLRIFVGVMALAFFWAATVKRNWIDAIIILAAAVPLALLVNALRICVIGLCITKFDSKEAQSVVHDWSGYLMIPTAALLLWAIKFYWEHLYVMEDQPYLTGRSGKQLSEINQAT